MSRTPDPSISKPADLQATAVSHRSTGLEPEDDSSLTQPALPEKDAELDDFDAINAIDTANDDCWDVFIADDDEFDRLPEPGDFWIEPD